MIFKGVHNQTLELKIVNYQYPEITDDEFDSNWLNVFIDVHSKVGNWQTVDPSLDTSDIAYCIEWFKALSKNEKVQYEELGFTEPNLSFELRENTEQLKKIRIKFELESRPKSATDEKEYYIDCEFANEDLKKISEDFEEEFKKFPPRGLNK